MCREGDRVTGIVTADGEFHPADIVVSNMEVIPAYEKLLREDKELMRGLEKFEPSCSGLVLELGLDRKYPQLAHHNFFFSDHQKEHFDTVFRKHELPPDPTIYLVAASRTDPTVAPDGCDCLKILPHIPYIDDDRPLTREDYMAFKERVLDKLERMGLENLRRQSPNPVSPMLRAARSHKRGTPRAASRTASATLPSVAITTTNRMARSLSPNQSRLSGIQQMLGRDWSPVSNVPIDRSTVAT